MFSKSAGFWITLVLLWALGIFLRLYLLQDQIILDDEWHGLVLASRKTFHQILGLSSVGATSPISNLYYWVLLHTVGWSALLIRLPQIIAGISAVILFPLFTLRTLGRQRALLFSFLLSISPFLIFYSRNSRPYSIAVFLSFTALLCLYFWISEKRTRYAVLYVLCGALASYFHPATLIPVSSPLIALTGLHWKPLKNAPKPRLMITAGLCLALLVFAFYFPVMLKNPWIMKERREFGLISLDSFYGIWILMSGTAQPSLIAVFFALAVLGAVHLVRRKPLFGWICVSAYLPTFAFFSINQIEVPLFFTRYMITLLPINFIFVSHGLFAFINAKKSASWLKILKTLAAGIFLIFLCVKNPLARHYTRTPNNFMDHSAFQETYTRRAWNKHSYKIDGDGSYAMKKQHVPDYYFKIAQDPAISTILEYPMVVGDSLNLYYYYQHFHRKRVMIGYTSRLLIPAEVRRLYAYGDEPIDVLLSRLIDPEKLKFRNMIPLLNLKRVKDSGADRVIIHRNIFREMNPMEKELDPIYPPPIYLEKIYNKILGPAEYSDGEIVVFKMDREKMEKAIEKRKKGEWKPSAEGPFRPLKK